MSPQLGALGTRHRFASTALAMLTTLCATTSATSTWAQPGAAAPQRPAPEVRVIEDEHVRIEETRVRGQLQRITVAPKNPGGQPLRPYEINVGSGGRDPSQDKSAAGQRVWSVLRF